MVLKLKIFIYNLLFIKFKFWWMLHFNPLIRAQRKNPKLIPIVIINFNQLFYLKKLVDFLVARNFEKIVIVDNLSTYPPLLEYYKKLPRTVIVERMKENYGHMVFFQNTKLQEKYGKGFYVVTDADINFYESTPEDFMEKILNLLNRYHTTVTKVGFALNIEDLPDSYDLKPKVLAWEKQFSENEIEKEVYLTSIDTTFALYLPGFPVKNNKDSFYKSLRVAGAYKVKHGGWYQNSANRSAEEQYYLNSASGSFSWRTDADGNINSEFKEVY